MHSMAASVTSLTRYRDVSESLKQRIRGLTGLVLREDSVGRNVVEVMLR